MLETLEQRRLYAAGTSVLLTINGTPYVDNIQLSQTATQLLVNVNGVTTGHDLSWIVPSDNQYEPSSYGWISGVLVQGGEGNDYLWANDTVTLPTTLAGNNGSDNLRGGHGNDSLYGGYLPLPGMPVNNGVGDTLEGGAGNDRLYSGFGQAYGYLLGGVGNDTLLGQGVGDSLYGGSGNDVLTATVDYATLLGEAGNDTLSGVKHDYLDGGADDDVIKAGQGANTVYGGDGHDYITVANTNIYFWNYVDAGAGNDTVITSAGIENIYGGEGNDVINAGDGNNWVSGQGGNDSITGGAGDDSLYGDEGNDTLSGGAGKNKIWGLGGNDLMTAGAYADELNGGSGTDTVSYANRGLPVQVSLDGMANDGDALEKDLVSSDTENVIGGHGSDTLIGNGYNNVLTGGDGYDLIRGGTGNDTLYGNAGNDTVYGDYGDDKLDGGTEDDSIYGGFGNDTTYGGNGRDTLISIGGGDHDVNYGQGGEDSFWMDAAPYETYDGSASEIASGRNHLVLNFVNTYQRDPNGANLDDPQCDAEKAAYTNNNLLANRPLFGPDGPGVNDLRQGNVGDCYFLAALGSIAKANPDRIRESIVDMGDHTFAVRYFNSDGNAVYFRVDDDVPIDKTGGWIFYAGLGQGGSLWGAMMEKAFVVRQAGYNGNYEQVSGGSSKNVYKLMGLAPQTFGSWSSAASLSDIAGQLALGKAMTTGTDDGDFTLGDHVVLDHAYTIISVDLNANTITLRNPWGTDAGSAAGAWVQGANDGYATFTAQEWADNFNYAWSAYA